MVDGLLPCLRFKMSNHMELQGTIQGSKVPPCHRRGASLLSQWLQTIVPSADRCVAAWKAPEQQTRSKVSLLTVAVASRSIIIGSKVYWLKENAVENCIMLASDILNTRADIAGDEP